MERYKTKQKNKPIFQEAAKKARERAMYRDIHKHNVKLLNQELLFKHRMWETQQELWRITTQPIRQTVSWADRQLGTERHQPLPRRHGPSVMYEMPKPK